MADRSSPDFGHFLRTVRQRLGLSLLDVERSHSSAAYTLDKGTLSRFERGAQRLPATAITPLAGVYGIEPQALLDRLDLDEHADRLPLREEVEDASDCRERAVRALLKEGDRLSAYAWFRAAARHLEEERGETGSDEALAAARFNLASVARGLGKNHLALYELQCLEEQGSLDDAHIAILFDRIGNSYRCTHRFDRAERYLGESVRAARERGDARSEAFAVYSSAVLAHSREDWEACLAELTRSFRSYREADASAVVPDPAFETNVLLKAADAHLRSGATAKSKRATLHAKALARSLGNEAALGYCEVQLGEIAQAGGEQERARAHWFGVVRSRIAERNPRLRFAAGYLLYQDALDSNHRHRAQRYRARLDRWMPRVPRHLPMVDEYRRLRHAGA